MEYVGFLVWESYLWLWVHTCYLGPWTLRVWVMTYFLLRGYNILPQKELHSSLWVTTNTPTPKEVCIWGICYKELGVFIVEGERDYQYHSLNRLSVSLVSAMCSRIPG